MPKIENLGPVIEVVPYNASMLRGMAKTLRMWVGNDNGCLPLLVMAKEKNINNDDDETYS